MDVSQHALHELQNNKQQRHLYRICDYSAKLNFILM